MALAPLIALLALGTAPVPLAEVPFESVGGLICFQASLPGSPPLSALLDTGFDVTVLDSAVAARLGLEPRNVQAAAAPGGAVEAGHLAPLTLRLGSLAVDGAPLTTVPLAGLSSVIGRPLDLVLGHDVLQRFVVEIDWTRRRLRFFEPASYTHAGPGLVLNVEIRDAQPLVSAGITMAGGRSVFGLFKLDTASLDAAGLNLNFVRDQALLVPGTREIAVTGVALGGATEGRLFRAQGLWLGTRRFESPLLSYTLDSKGFENRVDAGTLGVAVLSRFRMILDYPRRRVILEDDPGAPARAAEDLSGAWLVSPAPDFGSVRVARVLPGSPAAQAGLADGDEIVRTAGLAASLAQARDLMQQPGPLQLTVRRQGVTRELTLLRRPLLP